jgi:serine/threonine protein kinase
MKPNEVIGNYRIDAVIGDGGMGTVYRGEDLRFGRPVAIKVLHEFLLRDEGVVSRFKSEAVIQAKLNHPNIVTVYDFIATDGMAAMVMQYVDGSALDGVIERCGGPMPMGQCMAIMTQVLAAIGHAHANGLVHRDLKPSNILVEELSGDLLAFVGDFGVAKILGSEKLRTATGAKMGTLAYMSPEQLRSPKLVDARSDIYALGVTLYEMLTGVVPFAGDTEYELMAQIIEQRFQPPARVVAGLPPWIEAVVLRAMDKDPDRRFQSCAEFRDALRFQEARPVVTPVSPIRSQPVAVPPLLERSEDGPGMAPALPDASKSYFWNRRILFALAWGVGTQVSVIVFNYAAQFLWRRLSGGWYTRRTSYLQIVIFEIVDLAAVTYQFLLLRSMLSMAWLWIVATMGASVLIEVLWQVLRPENIALIVAINLIVGLVQWLVLRGPRGRNALWIAASFGAVLLSNLLHLGFGPLAWLVRGVSLILRGYLLHWLLVKRATPTHAVNERS